MVKQILTVNSTELWQTPATARVASSRGSDGENCLVAASPDDRGREMFRGSKEEPHSQVTSKNPTKRLN